VRAVGVSSQGEAFTVVGADGEILSRAMVSSDTRATAVTRRWAARLGARRLYLVTGHTAHPMFTLFKLLWLRVARPELWGRARRFLCFEDLLGHRLGLAEPRISWSLAGRTLLFDAASTAGTPGCSPPPGCGQTSWPSRSAPAAFAAW
jgi:sugar (pentulose or hexulose) kinase